MRGRFISIVSSVFYWLIFSAFIFWIGSCFVLGFELTYFSLFFIFRFLCSGSMLWICAWVCASFVLLLCLLHITARVCSMVIILFCERGCGPEKRQYLQKPSSHCPLGDLLAVNIILLAAGPALMLGFGCALGSRWSGRVFLRRRAGMGDGDEREDGVGSKSRDWTMVRLKQRWRRIWRQRAGNERG